MELFRILAFGLTLSVSFLANAQSGAPSPRLGKPLIKSPQEVSQCRARCVRFGDGLSPVIHSDPRCEKACTGVPSSPVPSPSVRPSGNNRAFILLEPLVYEIGSSGRSITVPAGFVTDYASIPEALWSIYSPHDQYSRAAIVHDYLYWSQLCTREQADNLFMIAMKESDVPAAVRGKVYAGVAAGGDASWQDNRSQRERHMPRVVPPGRKDFHPNWSWEKYRNLLIREGLRDPEFTDDTYCALGNTSDVPSANPTMLSPSRFSAVRAVARALTGS